METSINLLIDRCCRCLHKALPFGGVLCLWCIIGIYQNTGGYMMDNFNEMINAIKALKHQSLNQSEQVVKIEISEFSSLYVYRLSSGYGRAIFEHWNTKHSVVYWERHAILYDDTLLTVSNHSVDVVTHKDDEALKWSLVDSYKLREHYRDILWIS